MSRKETLRGRVEGGSAAYEYHVLVEQKADREQLLELRLLVARELIEKSAAQLKRGDLATAEVTLTELAAFVGEAAPN